MSERLVIQKSTLVNIADGVRLKRGHSNNILVSNLRAEIDQISVPTEQLPEPSIQCYGVDISTSISDYDNVDGIYCDIYMDGTYALQEALGDSVDISSLIGSQGVTTGDVHTLFAVAKKEGYIPSKVGPPLHICYNGWEWEETDAPSGVSLLPQPSLSYNSDGDFEVYCEGASEEATVEWYLNNTFQVEWIIQETVQLDSFGSGTTNGEARLFSVVVKDGGKQSPMSNGLLYYWSESDNSFVEEIPSGTPSVSLSEGYVLENQVFTSVDETVDAPALLEVDKTYEITIDGVIGSTWYYDGIMGAWFYADKWQNYMAVAYETNDPETGDPYPKPKWFLLSEDYIGKSISVYDYDYMHG